MEFIFLEKDRNMWIGYLDVVWHKSGLHFLADFNVGISVY